MPSSAGSRVAGAAPSSTSFAFLKAWRRLFRDFWLADLDPLPSVGLVLCAVLAVLPASALLISASAHGLLLVLGEERWTLAFPYLRSALNLWHVQGLSTAGLGC